MLALGGAELASPKLSAAERRTSFFPYYAGFSEAFVRDVANALGIRDGSKVLDPWNGSGTTTTIISACGAEVTGLDINPALGVVAKARLAKSRDASDALALLKTHSGRLSALHLRRLCGSGRFSISQALLLLAVFRLVRRKLAGTELIGTNPTWWNLQRSDVQRLVGSLTVKQVAGELDWLTTTITPTTDRRGRVKLLNGDLLHTRMPRGQADFIITSPPYLTRIDYVKATLPELFVLSALRGIDINLLRRQMIGAPVVGRGPSEISVDIGNYAKSLLVQIGSHPSKASSTYYLAFFSTYIAKMLRALTLIADLASPAAQMVLVVQGSYYKEIYVDLPRLVSEMAQKAGFHLISKADFKFRQSFAQFNPRANGYNAETALESALLFERGAKGVF